MHVFFSSLRIRVVQPGAALALLPLALLPGLFRGYWVWWPFLLLLWAAWRLRHLEQALVHTAAAAVLWFVCAFYGARSLLCLPLLLLLVQCRTSGHSRQRCPWWRRGEWRPVLFPVLLCAALLGALTWWVGTALGSDWGRRIRELPTLAPPALLTAGLVLALAEAVVAETVFRGILWQGMEALKYKESGILVWQALLFGLARYQHLFGGIAGCVGGLLLGLLLGWIRKKSGGLLWPVVGHWLAAALFLVAAVWGIAAA